MGEGEEGYSLLNLMKYGNSMEAVCGLKQMQQRTSKCFANFVNRKCTVPSCMHTHKLRTTFLLHMRNKTINVTLEIHDFTWAQFTVRHIYILEPLLLLSLLVIIFAGKRAVCRTHSPSGSQPEWTYRRGECLHQTWCGYGS